MTFIAVGSGVWGRGSSIAIACRNAKSQGCGRNAKLRVWSTDDPEPYVDGMGYVTFSGWRLDEVGLFTPTGKAL